MRLLMVTRETGPDRRYGLGRSLAPLVQGLRQQGVAVRYFCQDDLAGDQLQRRDRIWQRLSALPGIAGHADRMAMAWAWLERLQIGWLAGQLARAQAYTHVHAHDPWLALGLWLGLRGKGGRSIRWGLTEHGFGSYSRATHDDGLAQSARAQRLLRWIEAAILRRADWVIAPTAAALAQLARDLRRPCVAPHWHQVPHARPAIAPVTTASRHQARIALGFGEDDFVVVGVGRLTPLKGFDRLIQACANQGHSRLRLLLLGGGDPAALLALAQSRSFADRLQIIHTDDVSPYLHAADLYASASSSESFGLANLEALCAGLPAICSAVGGVPEVVADGAWLTPNTTQSLTDAIAAMLADPLLRRQWSLRALARAAAWPTVQQVTQNYVAIYQPPRR